MKLELYAASGWVGINIGRGKLGNFKDDELGFDPVASFACLMENRGDEHLANNLLQIIQIIHLPFAAHRVDERISK